MGKWTPNYVDDVLHAKISNMVSGAIRRAAVENSKEQSISYDSFVNELDTGDSFTISLVDILVKELAHRRNRDRTTVSDRRLLADNTIKGLRSLASNNRSYANRLSGHPTRRTVNLTDYLAAPPTEMEVEEEDEFNMQESTAMEGARVNSDLYDAFITNTWPPSNARRITASPSPAVDEWPLPQPLRSPTSSSRPWPMPMANPVPPPSALTRQASLRRAARSRMVDFNDFTHRRRSSNRDSLRDTSRESSGTHPITAENVTEPRDGSTTWNRPHGRRFFPFSRTRQHETMWSEASDPLSVDPSDESGHYMIEPIMPTLFDAPPASDSYSRASPDAESRGDDILIRAPRWRRRMRAPEPQSMLSRHASPVIVYGPPTGSPAATPPARRDENEPPAPSTEEPVAYPTPGSSENGNLY